MNVSLLEQTECSKFLYATEVSLKVHDLQMQKKDLQIFAIQSLDDMIQEYTRYYPYDVNYTDVRWDPVLILHSSGSTGEPPLVCCGRSGATDKMNTGPPKPIQTNHATWAVVDNDRNLPTVEGRKNQSWALWNFEGSGGRYFAAFPPFHVSCKPTAIFSNAAK